MRCSGGWKIGSVCSGPWKVDGSVGELSACSGLQKSCQNLLFKGCGVCVCVCVFLGPWKVDGLMSRLDIGREWHGFE